MNTRHALAPIALATLLTLSGCGGGSDDNPAPPPATALSVTGTADSGAAIAGAPVTLRCATGSGSATTDADGRYSASITGGVAPCAVEVTGPDGSLHSLAEAGSGASVVANLTPLTELLTAQLAGASPAGFYANFDTAAQAQVTAANLAAARTALAAALVDHVDVAGAIDPIKDGLVAGNPLDQKVDTLNSALAAARITLPELVNTVTANPASAAPVRTVLSPAAAGCRGLRSVPMRVVSLSGTERLMVDATALTLTDARGTATALTDGGDCSFAQADGTAVLVSPESVAVSRFAAGGSAFNLSLALPEQAIAVSELAGTWNFVAYTRDPVGTSPSTYTPSHGTLIINADGSVTTAGLDCIGLDTCQPGDTGFTFVASPDGGFVLADAATGAANGLERAFAYRASNGTLMLVLSVDDPDNSGLYVATRQVVTALPTVGNVTRFRNFSINSAGAAGTITSDTSTIVSTEPAAGGSFVRTLSDGHAETFLLNTPRDGMRHRMAGSSLNTSGVDVSFNALVQLRPPGVGLTFSISSASNQNFFNTSVDAP